MFGSGLEASVRAGAVFSTTATFVSEISVLPSSSRNRTKMQAVESVGFRYGRFGNHVARKKHHGFSHTTGPNVRDFRRADGTRHDHQNSVKELSMNIEGQDCFGSVED